MKAGGLQEVLQDAKGGSSVLVVLWGGRGAECCQIVLVFYRGVIELYIFLFLSHRLRFWCAQFFRVLVRVWSRGLLTGFDLSVITCCPLTHFLIFPLVKSFTFCFFLIIVFVSFSNLERLDVQSTILPLFFLLLCFFFVC